MQKTFSTPQPISLYVEIGAGAVKVHARDDTDETQVNVDGPDADQVIAEQRGDQVVVVAPHKRGGFFNSSSDLHVTVIVPSNSELVTKLGSADLVATGSYGSARVRSGSGDVRVEDLGAESVVETGSGDIELEDAHGDLRIKSGSGDVDVRRLRKSAVVSTGSGNVTFGITEHDVIVKSGSGDVRVAEAHTDLSVSTASGDVVVGVIREGKLKAKAVSGDVLVGVPAGVPVWTDISAVSGQVSSTLEGTGQPEDGQDYVEIRATTVSGDIRLEQL